MHDGDHEDAPDHVRSWREFLRRVDVRGPIPMRFRVVRWGEGYVLQSIAFVPDRDATTGAVIPIRFQNTLPVALSDEAKAACIRQRVLGAFHHEALESIHIDAQRTFDPHEARWFSNLVADWRFVT